MGLREWFNNHPKTSGAIVGVCVLGCLGAVASQLLGNRHATRSDLPNEFYTVDDGKTYFIANASNVPPFQYEGKTAVRAAVYVCGGQKFIAYLDRYTPEAQKILLAHKQVPPWVEERGREMKKPGAEKWISAADSKAVMELIKVQPPAGVSGTPEPAEP